MAITCTVGATRTALREEGTGMRHYSGYTHCCVGGYMAWVSGLYTAQIVVHGAGLLSRQK